MISVIKFPSLSVRRTTIISTRLPRSNCGALCSTKSKQFNNSNSNFLKANQGTHPLEGWKVHPYWLPEDYLTPAEIAKHREESLRSENIKKRHDEIVARVNERMSNPEKYKKRPDPTRDIIISDASFIFNKCIHAFYLIQMELLMILYIRNPHLKDFSHIRLKIPEPTCRAILASWDRLWLQPSEG